MRTLEPLTFPEYHQAAKVTQRQVCGLDLSHLVVKPLGKEWGVWCNKCEEYGYDHNLVDKREARKVKVERAQAENELFPLDQPVEQSLAELGF